MRRALPVVLLFLAACAPIPSTPRIIVVTSPPEVKFITTTPAAPVVIVVTATPPPATALPILGASPTPTCVKSASLTAEEAGQALNVCGVIVDEGALPCDSCPNDKVYYLILKGGFQLVSYDMAFFGDSGFSYEGTCVEVDDEVELLAGRPVFVFSRADGYGVSACTTGAAGELVCSGDSYLTFVDPSMCY